jgi:hypothetical protein
MESSPDRFCAHEKSTPRKDRLTLEAVVEVAPGLVAELGRSARSQRKPERWRTKESLY